LLPLFSGNYIVSDESVQINKNVEYYDAESLYHHNISRQISNNLSKGILIEGESLDSIMRIYENVIADHEQRKQDGIEAKAIKEQNYIRDAPVRYWEAYNREAIRASDKRISEERAATLKAYNDNIIAKKLEWINQHGSDRLKESIKQGFNCQKIYVLEKGQSILGDGYVLDYECDVSTNDRSCPSMAALNEVNSLKEKGIDSTIVWLPDGIGQICGCYLDQDVSDLHEAIEVEFKGLKGYWYFMVGGE
jgi:hypothetical protein